jgi:hypothetical protein
MSAFWIIECFSLSIVACGLIILSAPLWIARVLVVAVRGLGMGVFFPTAVGVATLIVNHPEQWSSDKYRLIHPDFGSIWIANQAYGLHFELPTGDWKPNLIERLIIWEAVEYHMQRYIRDRLTIAVRKNMLLP